MSIGYYLLSSSALSLLLDIPCSKVAIEMTV